MKKFYYILLAFLLSGVIAHAATTIPLGKNQLLQYILQTADSLVVGNTATTTYARLEVNGTTTALMFNATSTTASSSLPRVSSTGISTTFLCLNGDTCRTTWPTGGSGTGLASSTPWTKGQLAVVASDGALYGVSTTTVTCSGTVSCTSFIIPGSSPITLTGSGGSSLPRTYSYFVDADGGGDFTTIQGALDACGVAGGGSIYLTDHYYYLGATGLLFKGNDCNVYGVYASTTLEVAGATTAFKTNSAASAYANNGVHNVVIVGDGNTGSIGIDMSDMIRSRYTGIVMDNLGRGFRLNDTQNVTFYNTVRDFAITTIQVAGIDASSTNPTNDNKFSDGFIGCGVSGCIGINLNNAQNNLFYSVSIEPATITGTIGVKIDVDARAANSGTFANQFYGLYAEANKIGIAASSSISSTKEIHSNGFYGGQIVANTTDTLDSSNGESISFFGVNINYEQVNQMSSTTFKGGTFFAGLGDCDTGATSKVLYDVTTGRFSCGTDQSVAGGGLPGNLYSGSIGQFGIGSSSPWATLSVVGTSTTNPIFALSTSTSAYPFFWAQNPNSSSTIPYNGASVSQVGINFPMNGTTTLRDNTYIGGRKREVDFNIECSTFGNIVTNVAADTHSVCGNWGYDYDTDMTLQAFTGLGMFDGQAFPYASMQAASPVTGDTGAIRGGAYFSGTSTSVFETTVSYDSATSSSFRSVLGFSSVTFTTDYVTGVTAATDGLYFEASSTANNAWRIVVKSDNISRAFVDSGAPTSTTALTPQRFRIEWSANSADFFVNDSLVYRHTTNLPSRSMSPMITNGVVTTQTPTRSLRVYDARAWMGNTRKLFK